MDRQSNRFLEPERGSGTGMVGWAAKQLVLWGVGALVLYAVVANQQLFSGSGPARVSRQAAPAPRVEPRPAPAAAPVRPAQPEHLRALGQVVPPVIQSLSLRAQPDGYAYVKASVNGAEMVMAFDTGASSVSLTRADAIKAGVAGSLNYSLSFWTANGRGRGAPVMLREIPIGQLVIPDVHAVVMENMQVSLLGQTFLSRLHGYTMQDGVLTLTWQ
jgi:clan AA aspartic protease (TIGR02281 family)